MPVFIIEHLETKLYRWCLIEYKHVSRIVGLENLWFTNCKSRVLEKYGRVIEESVSRLELQNACVLDPEAQQILSPNDKFDYYIFGGILGDYPPKKRTKAELTKKIKATSRNIGKKQMSTDNAVFAVKKIIEGTPLKSLKFVDKLEIPLGENESTILPYRYPLVDGKPFISRELLNYLKNKKGF